MCPFHESSRRSDGSVLDDGKDDNAIADHITTNIPFTCYHLYGRNLQTKRHKISDYSIRQSYFNLGHSALCYTFSARADSSLNRKADTGNLLTSSISPMKLFHYRRRRRFHRPLHGSWKNDLARLSPLHATFFFVCLSLSRPFNTSIMILVFLR